LPEKPFIIGKDPAVGRIASIVLPPIGKGSALASGACPQSDQYQ